MPLVVNCSCGKRLQVRDELAGKKFRCPACQSVIEAPSVDQSGTAVLVATPEAPPAPPPPPKKSRTVAIQAQPVIAAIVQPAVKAVVQSADGDDASDEDEAPKKKKKKKKKPSKSSSEGANWGLIAGLGGGALVLALLVLAGIFVLPKMMAEVELDEKAIFQGEPEAFVTIDTQKLFSTNEGALIQKYIMRGALGENNFFKAMEIQLNDVQRVSIVVPVLKEFNSQAIFVVHTNKKMNRSKMDESKTATREDLNGRGIYRYAADSSCAYLCPGDKTLIFAPNKNALDAVTKLKGGTAPGTLASSVQQGLESERQFYVHYKNFETNTPPPTAAMAPFMPIGKYQTAKITADFGEKSSLSIALDYGEQGKASAAVVSLKSLPILMKTAQATMFAASARQKEVFNQASKYLNDLKINQDGKVVNLKLDFPGDSIGQMIAMMQEAATEGQVGFGTMFGGQLGGSGASGGQGGQGGRPPGGGRQGGGQSGMQGGGPSGGQPGGGGPSGKQGGSGPSGKQGGNRPSGNSNPPPGSSNNGSGGSGSGMSNIRNGSPGAAVMASRGAGDRAFNQNQLRAIGRAMQMYSDAEGGLPAAALCDPSGKPLLSWRVAILPYLEQDNLYKQFHLNEPWDSPHNLTLLPLMPKFFSPRNQSGETITPYRAFANGGALELNRKTPITSFSDGASNTFLVVETFDTVEWTKPDSLDPNNIPVLGSGGKGQFSAVLGDGSVRSFPSNMPDIKAWATRAGGESITP